MAKPHIRLQRPDCCIRVYIDGTPSKEVWSLFMSLAAKLYSEQPPAKHSVRFRGIELGVDNDTDWKELLEALGAGERAWKAEHPEPAKP